MTNEVYMHKINYKAIVILSIIMICSINSLSTTPTVKNITAIDKLERIKLFKSSFLDSLQKRNKIKLEESNIEFLEKVIEKSKLIVNQSPISKLIL